MIADLHIHSTSSDGQYTPSQIVYLAKEHGIEVLALTDHDTLDGLDEAVSVGETVGVHVLRGVELGSKEYRSLHLLGYGFSPAAPGLRELCKWMKQGRDERKYRILDFLREKGLEITLREVEEIAGGEIIARPHFARALVQRGYVTTAKEAFERYLDTVEYQRIERIKPSARTCIESIHKAGGKVSLAHPYQIGLANEALTQLVKQLIGDGLDAIECFYPLHTPEQQAFYLWLADKYGLYVTGGSDFHGECVKPDVQMAGLELDVGWLLA